MLLRCCLIHISIIIVRHFLYLLYMCSYLDLGLFMLYLCELCFIFILIFLMINRMHCVKNEQFFATLQYLETGSILRTIQSLYINRTRQATIVKPFYKWVKWTYLIFRVDYSKTFHCVKSVQIRSCFWSVFSWNLTRNNYVFGNFSRGDLELRKMVHYQHNLNNVLELIRINFTS